MTTLHCFFYSMRHFAFASCCTLLLLSSKRWFILFFSVSIGCAILMNGIIYLQNSFFNIWFKGQKGEEGQKSKKVKKDKKSKTDDYSAVATSYLGALTSDVIPKPFSEEEFIPVVATTSNHINEELDIAELSNKKEAKYG